MIRIPNTWLNVLVVASLTIFSATSKNKFNVIFNPTSVQVGQKWDFRLSTNLVGSELLYSRQVVGKLVLKILPMLDRIFLPVDISLENVLTGKENFFATVDFRSLQFRL